jgi:hypothetical protein
MGAGRMRTNFLLIIPLRNGHLKDGGEGKIDLTEINFEDGRWMEVVHERVLWQALVLAVLTFEVCYHSVGISSLTPGSTKYCNLPDIFICYL